jgi:hypothetical protein
MKRKRPPRAESLPARARTAQHSPAYLTRAPSADLLRALDSTLIDIALAHPVLCADATALLYVHT